MTIFGDQHIYLGNIILFMLSDKIRFLTVTREEKRLSENVKCPKWNAMYVGKLYATTKFFIRFHCIMQPARKS